MLQNEDKKGSTENEKNTVEESVKEEVLEVKKPAEDAKSNEPIVKQESPRPDEKLSEESRNNESSKQENETLKTETSPGTLSGVGT